MSIVCPCCGASMGEIDAKDLLDVPMTVQQRQILTELVARYPRFVSLDWLINAVWGLRPDGGPDEPVNSLRVQLAHINRAIKPFGFRISARKHGIRVLERTADTPDFSPLSTQVLRIGDGTSVSACEGGFPRLSYSKAQF